MNDRGDYRTAPGLLNTSHQLYKPYWEGYQLLAVIYNNKNNHCKAKTLHFDIKYTALVFQAWTVGRVKDVSKRVKKNLQEFFAAILCILLYFIHLKEFLQVGNGPQNGAHPLKS